jgi:prepilin-type N-terminal cleavage/methylation domain-containing protein
MESIYHRRGFTVLELLVAFSIVTIITSIAMASQSNFNRSFILSNTAFDIGLAIRNAETFGLASRAKSSIENTGYGLHFDNSSDTVFTLFADTLPTRSTICYENADPGAPDEKTGDCAYTEGERVMDYTLNNGIRIDNFCASTGVSTQCWKGAGTISGGLQSLDIVFARPNPISLMSVNGLYSKSSPVTKACIALTSPQGGFKYVSVSLTGEVNANASQCPL